MGEARGFLIVGCGMWDVEGVKIVEGVEGKGSYKLMLFQYLELFVAAPLRSLLF
jgi:hypothetical protein